MGYDSEDIVVIQGIMDVVIKEDDGYVIIELQDRTLKERPRSFAIIIKSRWLLQTRA